MLVYKIQIWMENQKKRIQFNNIHVWEKGICCCRLFNAFRFITCNLYINGKSVYCVVMCTAQFIDIQFFFLSARSLFVRSFVNKNWHWCARHSCQIVFNNKEVMNFIPNIFIHSKHRAQSLTFDWLLSPVIFYLSHVIVMCWHSI